MSTLNISSSDQKEAEERLAVYLKPFAETPADQFISASAADIKKQARQNFSNK